MLDPGHTARGAHDAEQACGLAHVLAWAEATRQQRHDRGWAIDLDEDGAIHMLPREPDAPALAILPTEDGYFVLVCDLDDAAAAELGPYPTLEAALADLSAACRAAS